MYVILLFLSAAGICVTIGGLGIHFENQKRIDDLEQAILMYDKDLTKNKKDIRVLKERAAQNSDRAYLIHISDREDCDQLKFGGF